MTENNISTMSTNYAKCYATHQSIHLYPVEFVVRTFLGSYKNLYLDKSLYKGKRILDLGFGDGRNMPLLSNLGFEISGIEISDAINTMISDRLRNIGISAILKIGHNSNIPFPDRHFHYLLACHTCYYVREGESFSDNLKEMNRILDSEGILICSLPWRDTYILEGSEEVAEGHFRIKNDPYKLRNGVIFRAFSNEEDIQKSLNDYFTDFCIGYCDDNFYGLQQKIWIVTCRKK